MKNILKSIIGFVYPNKCYACGKIIPEDKHLCDSCRSDLPLVDADKRCLKCGIYKDGCDCRRNVYYFEKVIAPLFNSGSAKNIVYRYKLGGKEHIAKYIALWMFKAVRMEYGDVRFDCIVAVPPSKKSEFFNRIDHTYILAKELSRLLKVPVKKGVIGAKSFVSPQHKSDIKKRFFNVKNKYYIRKKIKAENVLLIDDIKTTGATLSAVARELLFAGAGSVYCVTALVSDNKNNAKKVKKSLDNSTSV